MVNDLKGNSIEAHRFDENRLKAIQEINVMISEYLSEKSELKVFKSLLDGYNKRNNLWGFAAMKGQMFFNQLTNSSGSNLSKLDSVIKDCITTPTNVAEAKTKINKLTDYIEAISANIEEKRKAPKKGSVSYFLSYFWQVSNPQKYPIIYTSLIDAMIEHDLWVDKDNSADEYEFFFNLSNEIKDFLSNDLKKEINHWDVEHCFWLSLTGQGVISPAKKQIKEQVEKIIVQKINSTFEMLDYVPPVVSDLVEAGALEGDTRAIKGYSFEKKVAALFRMLDFESEDGLGQGKGREPDGILTYRQDNIAFIYDAKVRENGYSIGTDNRAIKEYINNHYPKLEKQGYKNIGFLIISSKFNGNPREIIREIKVGTSIKWFSLITSEALLGLLAFKLKNGLSTSQIADFLLEDGELTFDDVKESFSDV